jgi:hypothetical protein
MRRLDADVQVPLTGGRSLRTGRDDTAHILFDLSPQAWNDLFPDLSLLSVDYSNIESRS